MKGTLERELRLRAEAGFRLPTLPGQPLRTRRFSSTYHDTPDHRLAALGVTLRFRAENGEGIWHLDIPATPAIAVKQPGTPGKVPQRLRDLVAAAVGERELCEVATLDTLRRGIRVEERGRPVADVLVDQVVVRAGGSAVRAFDEIEVDLVDGDAADL